MVAHHICKLPVVKAAQICTNLIRLEGLIEVKRNLSSNLGEHCWVHTSLASFFEEEVLGLGQAQIAILSQSFLQEVGCLALRWQLAGLCDHMFKYPGRLLEEFACNFDAFPAKIEEASSPCEAHSIVVEGRESAEKGRLRGYLPSVVGVMPGEGHI